MSNNKYVVGFLGSNQAEEDFIVEIKAKDLDEVLKVMVDSLNGYNLDWTRDVKAKWENLDELEPNDVKVKRGSKQVVVDLDGSQKTYDCDLILDTGSVYNYLDTIPYSDVQEYKDHMDCVALSLDGKGNIIESEKKVDESLKEGKGCKYIVYLNHEPYITVDSYDKAMQIESEIYAAASSEDDFQAYYGWYPEVEIREVCDENLKEELDDYSNRWERLARGRGTTKFTVYGYYDNKYRCLANSKVFDNGDDAREYAWELLQKGNYVKVDGNRISPDDVEDFEDIPFEWFIEGLDESLKEDVNSNFPKEVNEIIEETKKHIENLGFLELTSQEVNGDMVTLEYTYTDKTVDDYPHLDGCVFKVEFLYTEEDPEYDQDPEVDIHLYYQDPDSFDFDDLDGAFIELNDYTKESLIGKLSEFINDNLLDSVRDGLGYEDDEDYDESLKEGSSIHDLNKEKEEIKNKKNLSKKQKDKLNHNLECKKSELWNKLGKGLNESLEEEPKLDTFDEQMDFLAKDEQEAIDSYETILALVDDENVKEQLNKIMIEEKAHKDFLEKVKGDRSLKYTEPLEDSEENDDLDEEYIKNLYNKWI